ncbi:very short patch repair endonuclease [Myxococcus sp. MxC21-1]|uniref:very short patch repair endonuclease n=1 Tax=Myxococcus sp. MxC21-1 TaxID=3041439 RepID=UPI00292F0C42|nr:very short patch repair endonuclease [Myxococcus sp. MxC21-1]WNZ66146.1 very short patch repair endonuclease [Myxococcus sp. MxC21-1]
MARIRGRNTSPELALRRALHAEGLRYRVNHRLPVGGRPDVVFSKARVVVFVDGCQWHGCPEHYVRPRTRAEFWGAKLAGNVERDRRQTHELALLGWRPLRFWEHELAENLNGVVERIKLALAGKFPGETGDWRVWRVEVIDQETDLERRHEVRLAEHPVSRRIVERRRSTKKWRKRSPATVAPQRS